MKLESCSGVTPRPLAVSHDSTFVPAAAFFMFFPAKRRKVDDGPEASAHQCDLFPVVVALLCRVDDEDDGGCLLFCLGDFLCSDPALLFAFEESVDLFSFFFFAITNVGLSVPPQLRCALAVISRDLIFILLTLTLLLCTFMAE